MSRNRKEMPQKSVNLTLAKICFFISNGQTNSTFVLILGAIHAASFAGMDHVIDYFLKERDVDADQFNTSGFTPLYYAIRGRHTSTAQLLLNAGADPSINLPTKLTQGELKTL